MKRPPAFQIYARDEITDYPGISASARGVFLVLRCRCWLKGSIPIALDELARLALCPRREFVRAWPQIRPYFQRRRSSYVFAPLKEQRARQIANRGSKSDNGKLGALVRWGPQGVERYNPRVIYAVVDTEFFKFHTANNHQPSRDELFKLATGALVQHKINHTAKLIDDAIDGVVRIFLKRQGRA